MKRDVLLEDDVPASFFVFPAELARLIDPLPLRLRVSLWRLESLFRLEVRLISSERRERKQELHDQ
jgi:hypothetical protein